MSTTATPTDAALTTPATPGGASAAERDHQVPLYAQRGLTLVRGEGSYLYDDAGRRYLDAMSNYGVAVLGHADPAFAAALTDQLATLTTCHQSFGSDVRAELLTAIQRIAPEGLTRTFLSNSGAEAVEAALKFAIAATGRHRIVAARRGYHGRTLGALSATADPKYRGPFEPLPIPATHVPFDDAAALAAAIDDDTAAVILEPVQGEAGIYPADDDYLRAVRRTCDERGVLLIMDEIQSGFRTGHWWASAHAGVVPDIMVTAKALANGFPIGLTLVTEWVSERVPAGAHGSTFGGNPLAARAALATLARFEELGLHANAAETGDYLVAGLRGLGSPKVRDVRGRGLMIGVELKARVTPTLRALQDRGVLVLPAGPLTFRVLPPLVWGRAQADEFLAAMGEVLA
jgi:LysW-gamma-L-lysine/LysW-L-ornithine aminotransferase